MRSTPGISGIRRRREDVQRRRQICLLLLIGLITDGADKVVRHDEQRDEEGSGWQPERDDAGPGKDARLEEGNHARGDEDDGGPDREIAEPARDQRLRFVVLQNGHAKCQILEDEGGDHHGEKQPGKVVEHLNNLGTALGSEGRHRPDHARKQKHGDAEGAANQLAQRQHWRLIALDSAHQHIHDRGPGSVEAGRIHPQHHAGPDLQVAIGIDVRNVLGRGGRWMGREKASCQEEAKSKQDGECRAAPGTQNLRSNIHSLDPLVPIMSPSPVCAI